uniref:Uncharacterized protein n=1 Tax=Chromera velia CCMP2878 TaxID=1169474 RepID=A0A0G4IB19_9ALVE|eukprot:Cvel_12723.t1-p1 / transcript=Cvel_12723.t1 / gene=Cvel_12723 / organism=Chromera_velia_CCMP2878 / gene_product=hypothetical protein / transcript_product=hypothetical protein / location=Cvel_scaffold845:11948-13462(+) / protein_length=505 / sequence_SO=supercontig / SO=protein_coding / is_pseudo=false
MSLERAFSVTAFPSMRVESLKELIGQRMHWKQLDTGSRLFLPECPEKCRSRRPSLAAAVGRGVGLFGGAAAVPAAPAVGRGVGPFGAPGAAAAPAAPAVGRGVGLFGGAAAVPAAPFGAPGAAPASREEVCVHRGRELENGRTLSEYKDELNTVGDMNGLTRLIGEPSPEFALLSQIRYPPRFQFCSFVLSRSVCASNGSMSCEAQLEREDINGRWEDIESVLQGDIDQFAREAVLELREAPPQRTFVARTVPLFPLPSSEVTKENITAGIRAVWKDQNDRGATKISVFPRVMRWQRDEFLSCMFFLKRHPLFGFGKQSVHQICDIVLRWLALPPSQWLERDSEDSIRARPSLGVRTVRTKVECIAELAGEPRYRHIPGLVRGSPLDLSTLQERQTLYSEDGKDTLPVSTCLREGGEGDEGGYQEEGVRLGVRKAVGTVRLECESLHVGGRYRLSVRGLGGSRSYDATFVVEDPTQSLPSAAGGLAPSGQTWVRLNDFGWAAGIS